MPAAKGARGEDFAAERLTALGYRVVDRNYHSRYGEVDIIAVKGDVICFVEVKTRRGDAMVSGAQAVSRSKQRKIITTALQYLQRHPEYDLQPRFDVFSVVTAGEGKAPEYDYLMGAFDGEAYTD